MKKMNMKAKRKMIISTLLVIGVILVGAIYVNTNQESTNEDILIEENITTETVVDAIEVPKENTVTVVVSEIKEDVVTKDIDNKVEAEIIEEPLPTEPEKPKNTPPEKKPQTKNDVEDMTKEPEYEKEEVIYISDETEKDTLVSEQTTKPNQNDRDEESNQVSDSENPFLQDNIPNNGDGGEIKFDDVTEHVPGTGDKF
jgi:outer membrane biosynthesis protein TonB